METVWQRLRHLLQPTDATPPGVTLADGCFWRADMHAHLLPGVDDGVASPDEALTCLKQLAEWGVQTVIVTPHVSRDWFPDNTTELLRAGQAQLQTLSDENGVPIRIAVAAEYMLDDYFPTLLAGRDLLAFGPENYVLVETGWASAPLFLDEVLFRIRTAGYVPVLAHPERYTYFHADWPRLAQLREGGCLFQLNWMSLTGRYGSRVQAQARKLLQSGWVDFIGSDLHRPADLPALASLFTSPDYALLRRQPLRNQDLIGPS